MLPPDVKINSYCNQVDVCRSVGLTPFSEEKKMLKGGEKKKGIDKRGPKFKMNDISGTPRSVTKYREMKWCSEKSFFKCWYLSFRNVSVDCMTHMRGQFLMIQNFLVW